MTDPSQPPRLSKEREAELRRLVADGDERDIYSHTSVAQLLAELSALRLDVASARSAAFAEGVEAAAKKCDEEEERSRKVVAIAGYNASYDLGRHDAARHLAARARALVAAPPAEPEVRVGDVYRSGDGKEWTVFASGRGVRLREPRSGDEVDRQVADLAESWWRLVRRGEPQR